VIYFHVKDAIIKTATHSFLFFMYFKENIVKDSNPKGLLNHLLY